MRSSNTNRASQRWKNHCVMLPFDGATTAVNITDTETLASGAKQAGVQPAHFQRLLGWLLAKLTELLIELDEERLFAARKKGQR